MLVAGALLVGACSTADAVDTSTASDSSAAEGTATNVSAEVAASDQAGGVFDTSIVHEISIEVDPDDFQEAVASYLDSGDKEWIEATVTIDGATYEQVGIRLKGNSSLRGLSADSDPETLPWLIRFDKYVDGQTHEGYADLVIRSNNSATALNEAVALDLLDAAGLASQQAVFTGLSVNGSEEVLRLVIEHPDDVWMAATLDADGALYKAESTGDYSYRGDDPDAYDEVFDQEAGKDNADLAPLTEFLDFINNADDATFEAELADHLDVEAFADYLAMMDLVDNFDDIDGPGNNSYLYYDTDIGMFTVVPWDMNLAFGAVPGGGGAVPGQGSTDGPGAFDGQGEAGQLGERPQRPGFDGEAPVIDGEAPAIGDDVAADAGRGGPSGSNILAERFRATDSFAQLYQQALADLEAELFDSGVASDLLAERVAVLDGASDLVDSATVESEASAMEAALA
jgi:spore coat protein CotH